MNATIVPMRPYEGTRPCDSEAPGVAARPVRLQLSRRRGFRLQVASLTLNGLPAIRVTRPGPMGNPYRVEEGTRWWWCTSDRGIVLRFNHKIDACSAAVRLYAELVESRPTLRATIIQQLRGHNLACTCPLEDDYGRRFPCHADHLLELANG